MKWENSTGNVWVYYKVKTYLNLLYSMANNYRLPTKLQEGNVFTGVCLSMMWVFLVPGPLWGRMSTQGMGMSGISIQGGEYLGSVCPGLSTWGEYPVLSTWEVSTQGGVSSQGLSTQWDEYFGDSTWRWVSQGVGALPLVTPSGSHQNMYSWQAGSTHPTGMLSCFKYIFMKFEYVTFTSQESFV